MRLTIGGVFAAFGLMVMPVILEAQDDITTVRSWRCSMPTYTDLSWDGRDLPRLTTGSQTFVIQIDGVDIEEGTARLIGNNGSEDLRVFSFGTLLGGPGLTFVEFTPIGSMNVVVIYPTEKSMVNGRKSYKAVTSRHPNIGGPSPSQAYGFCTVWT